MTHSAAGNETPLQMAMLLYPGLTLLDLIGPQAVLGMHGQTQLVAKTLDLVVSEAEVTAKALNFMADAIARNGEQALVVDAHWQASTPATIAAC